MERNELQDLIEVEEQQQRILQGVRNLLALPDWVQAAHSFVTYNPEAVLHQVRRWSARLEASENTEGRMIAVLIGAHRIHRFGAGPAIAPGIWIHVLDAIASLEHPEDLAGATGEGPLEPRYFAHAGHERGVWPYRILPQEWYSEEGHLPV